MPVSIRTLDDVEPIQLFLTENPLATIAKNSNAYAVVKRHGQDKIGCRPWHDVTAGEIGR